VEECAERWDLWNALKKKKSRMDLEKMGVEKKTIDQRIDILEKNLVRDDITAVVIFL